MRIFLHGAAVLGKRDDDGQRSAGPTEDIGILGDR